ncbi:MAG: DUF2817 domain-containing protein [Actinomycetia bacterium]|nr:DUF2817 domain-containing protein [Actinomycetes bacterium]
MTTPLASNYQEARRRFLAASQQAGATVDAHVHPLRGPDGGELAVDVATIGGAADRNLVVVVSGTHGVEGFAGSAIQSRLLEQGVTLPRSTTLVLIHALNPYGFAWIRRTNEDNIDLNRNFVPFDAPPSNDRYSEIADLLVPSSWDDDSQEHSFGALLALLEQWGMAELQEVVSSGQYEHPLGLFYGGVKPSWSHELLHELCAGHLSGYEQTFIVDLHTGLGPWGVGELISALPPTSAEFERDLNALGDDLKSVVSGDSVSAALSGEWITAATSWLRPSVVTAVTIEYGVVDIIEVLLALRADTWLHGYGDPSGSEAGAIKAALRAAFIDDSPEWAELTWNRFTEVMDRIARSLGA